MNQECPGLPFLPVYVDFDWSKTVFKLIKNEKEIGFTLLAGISL